MLGIKKNKAINGNLSTILTIMIVVVVVTVLYTVYKAVKKASELAGEAASDLIIQKQTGVSIDRQAYLKKLAQTAHGIFYSKNIFGFYTSKFNTDEEAVIRTLNEIVSKNETLLFCDNYKTIDGNSIKSGVDNDLNDTEISRIKATVYNNLS